MPRPPRFQTEHAQRIAVAVFTLTLLLLSLGLAWAVTLSRRIDWSAPLSPTTVGTLRIELPEQWRRSESISVEPSITGASPVFEEERLPGRAIHVFRKDMPFPSPPQAALLHVLSSLRKRHGLVFTETVRQEFFRQGTCVGIRFQARSQAHAKAAVFTSRIAVMTEDGRRNWGVALHLPIHQSPESETSTELLFNRIVSSMIDDEFSHANAVAFGGAELQDWGDALGPTIQPRVQRGSPLQPVTLVPTNGDAGLCLVRVRGQTHVSALDALPRLETARGLRRVFSDIHGRNPTDAELTSPDPAAPGSLLLRISDGEKTGLMRQMLYAPVSEQRAILVEMLAEPAMMPRAAAMAAAAVSAARKAASQPAPSSNGANANGSPVEAALARGAVIARAQRAAIANATFEPGYALQLAGTLPVGTSIELRRVDPGSRVPLSRRQVAVFTRQNRQVQVRRVQAAVADAREMIEAVSIAEFRDGAIDRSDRYELALKGNDLTLRTDPVPPGRDYLWTEKVKDQYLPSMAQDDWSMATLEKEAAASAALVDRTINRGRPYPYWIRFARLPKGPGSQGHPASSDVPVEAAAVVTLRPMMAMDAQTLWLAGNGRVIATDTPEDDGQPAGADWLILRPASLADVVALNPRNADSIKSWQQEAIQDD